MRVLHDERGETLIEILMTMLVMGIGLVAVVGAMGSSILSSDAHRNLAQAEVIARDFGEAVKAKAQTNVGDPAGYVPCADASFLDPGTAFSPPDDSAWDGWKVAIGDPAVANDGVEWWLPDVDNFPNGAFVDGAGDPYTYNDCRAVYDACNLVENPPVPPSPDASAEEPSCDVGHQRVTLTVYNDREDYAKVLVEARVLTRRPNS